MLKHLAFHRPGLEMLDPHQGYMPAYEKELLDPVFRPSNCLQCAAPIPPPVSGLGEGAWAGLVPPRPAAGDGGGAEAAAPLRQ